MDTVARMRSMIKSYPPVRTVVSEQGRGDDGTDPDGSFVAEFFVPLKPREEWPSGLTKEEMVRQMSQQLKREFVGVDFNFSQYIQDNIEEAVSGVKGENSVKIFGRDLAELERLSKSLKTEIATVPGVTDPGGVQPVGSAKSHHQDRSCEGGALRLLRRGHQFRGAGGHRRAGSHARLRRRDEFRAHRALRARIPAQHRCHPLDSGCAPEQRSQGADRLYRIGRARRRDTGNRRRLYLPREQPAFRAAQIQRTRPRSRFDRRGGAKASSAKSCRCPRATASSGPANSAP